jgi:hypothetical protein
MPTKTTLWMDVERAIPPQFTDNGFSTPWPLRMFRGPLSIIATRYSPLESRFGRVHDWLFWFGRLPGAPEDTEKLGLWGANQVAYDMMMFFGYCRTARVVRGVLDRYGHRSWMLAEKAMKKRGLATYDDYLRELAELYAEAGGK